MRVLRSAAFSNSLRALLTADLSGECCTLDRFTEMDIVLAYLSMMLRSVVAHILFIIYGPAQVVLLTDSLVSGMCFMIYLFALG